MAVHLDYESESSRDRAVALGGYRIIFYHEKSFNIIFSQGKF